MKIRCKKNDLAKAISTVARAIVAKPQTPILSGIYLEAYDDTLELQATDFEIGIAAKIPAEVEEKGSVVIAGRYLQDVARNLPGESVYINSASGVVNLKSDGASFNLLSLAVTEGLQEFPKLIPLKGYSTLTLPDNLVKHCIRRTSFACGAEEGRPVFTGCLFELQDSQLTMAATDTHRLSLVQQNLEAVDGIKAKVIIPDRILDELEHSINSEIPSPLEIHFDYSEVGFVMDNLYMMSRLIEGAFPDYRRVIPTDYKTRVKLETETFTRVLDRVALIANRGEFNTVKLEFSVNQVRLSSKSKEIGDAEESMAAEIDGEDITICFNAKYLLDVLKTISSKYFYLSLNSSLSPAAVKDPDDESYLYIITPVRA